MYIKQVFSYKHDFWRYLVGVVLVVLGLTLGQVPWTLVVLKKNGPDIFGMTETEMMNSLDSNLSLFLLLLSFAIGLLALFIVVKKFHKQPIVALTTSRNKIDWNRCFFSFFITAILIFAGISIEYFLNPENYEWNFNLGPFLILLAISLLLIPLQTSFEEYLFRGYLMQGIGVFVKNRWVPLLITSVVFGLLHFANPEVETFGKFIMVSYIGIGLLLGIITLMDEGMELALGFHAANNILIAVLVTSEFTAFQTNSILKDISVPEVVGWDVFIELLIVYPIILGIFSKKYKWTNWKDKLFGKIEKPSPPVVSEEI